ncbi:hypothetical protein D3C85_1595750 [compost metagenome]
MVSEILPQGYKVQTEHGNVRLSQPVMHPAWKSKGDQNAVEHPAHGGWVIDGFPQLTDDYDRKNNWSEINRYQRVRSSYIAIQQDGHQET